MDPAFLREVSNNGTPVASGLGVTKGVYMFGNYIVNGLVLGADLSALGSSFGAYGGVPYKTFIQGRLVSLNTLTSVSAQRIKHLFSLLSNRTPDYNTLSAIGMNRYFPNNTWNASMGDLFSWSCSDKIFPDEHTE